MTRLSKLDAEFAERLDDLAHCLAPDMTPFTFIHADTPLWGQQQCDGDTVMLCPEEKPCGICGTPTPWVSISFEWHYCSPTCLGQMWDGLNAACQVEAEREEVFQRLADG